MVEGEEVTALLAVRDEATSIAANERKTVTRKMYDSFGLRSSTVNGSCIKVNSKCTRPALINELVSMTFCPLRDAQWNKKKAMESEYK